MMKVLKLQVLIASLLFTVLVAVIPQTALAGFCNGSVCIITDDPSLRPAGSTTCVDDSQCPAAAPSAPVSTEIDLKSIQTAAIPEFKFETLGDVVSNIVPYLFTLAGLLLLLYLIFGGFSLMMSRGDPKAMEAAKGKITNAAIGFAIVFTAYWLVQLLGQILGIQQFGEIFRR